MTKYRVEDFELPSPKVHAAADVALGAYTLGVGNYLVRRHKKGEAMKQLEVLVDNLNRVSALNRQEVRVKLEQAAARLDFPLNSLGAVSLLEARVGDTATEGSFASATVSKNNFLGFKDWSVGITAGKFESVSRVGDDEQRKIDTGQLVLTVEELRFLGSLQARYLPHKDLMSVSISGNQLGLYYKTEKLVQILQLGSDVDLAVFGSLLALSSRDPSGLAQLGREEILDASVDAYHHLLVRKSKTQVAEFAKPKPGLDF